MRRNLIFIILCTLFFACKNSSLEQHFNTDEYKLRLKPEQIKECRLSLNMGHPALFFQNDSLWVVDYAAYTERPIYLIEGNEYEKAKGFLRIGKGPGEVVRPGEIVIHNNILYINDYGRSCLCSYRIDSMLRNPDYTKGKEYVFKNYLLSQIFFLNDSTVLSSAIHPLSINSFENKVVLANINTGEIQNWGYEHPEAIGRTLSSSNLVRLNDGGFARCYIWLDLITILNPDGTLRCNICGSHWGSHDVGEYEYCHDICSYKDYFLVSYVGDVSDIIDRNGRSRGNLPSQVLVFGNAGNHLATIEFGEKFNRMAVDEQKQRLVFTFYERDAMLGYIDLEPIFRNITQTVK